QRQHRVAADPGGSHRRVPNGGEPRRARRRKDDVRRDKREGEAAAARDACVRQRACGVVLRATGVTEARDTAAAVARRSFGKLVAFLAARTRDVAAAEDALSEAFASALADWPLKGCPSNPEAWLLTVARRKMVDAVRRRSNAEAATGKLQLLAEGLDAA